MCAKEQMQLTGGQICVAPLEYIVYTRDTQQVIGRMHRCSMCIYMCIYIQICGIILNIRI